MKQIIITLLYMGFFLTANAQYKAKAGNSALLSGYIITSQPALNAPVAVYQSVHKPGRYTLAGQTTRAPRLFCFSTRLAYKINRHWNIALKNECIHTLDRPGNNTVWHLALEKKFGAISVILLCENIFDANSPHKIAIPVPNTAFKELYTPPEGREVGLAICIKL